MNCDVGEAELILQRFRHFTYVTTPSPTFPSLYLRHSSFSNPSVDSPMSQFVLQPVFRFSYVTSSSFTSPGEPPNELSGSASENSDIPKKKLIRRLKSTARKSLHLRRKPSNYGKICTLGTRYSNQGYIFFE